MPTVTPSVAPARSRRPARAVDPGLTGALRMSLMRLSRRLRAQRSAPDLSMSQLSALATLDRHGALSPGELAAHEKVQPPSMTRTVAALEAAGLVVREPHPRDGRQVVLAASAAGRALLAEDRRRRDAWLSHRLAELTPEERAVLAAALPVLDRLAQS